MLIASSLLLAAGADSSAGATVNIPNLVAPILSTGIVGIVLIMLIFEVGFITKKSADREREAVQASHAAELKVKDDLIAGLRADVAELKVANSSLQVLTQDKMIPALVQATEVSRAYVAELARRSSIERGRDGNP